MIGQDTLGQNSPQADGDSAEAMRLLARTAAWLQRAVDLQHPTLPACRHNLQADAVDTPFHAKSGGRDACPSHSVPPLWQHSTLRHAQPGPGTSLLRAMSERLRPTALDACSGRPKAVVSPAGCDACLPRSRRLA
jgi:hypothetical protein